MRVADPKERYLLAALSVGLAFLGPLGFAAVRAGSLLLYAELARNIFEAAVKFLSLLAVRRVARGETSEYAYGQGKLEHLVGVLVATVMLVSVGLIATHALSLVLTPQQMGESDLGFAVTAAMALVNLYFWRRGAALARETHSPLMDSKWRMYRGRTLASLLVTASLGMALAMGTESTRYIDPIASLLLCLFILNSVRGVLGQALSGLLDKSLDESLQLLIIRELTRNFQTYEAIHGIRNRRSGSDVFIEIFLQFDGSRTMASVQTDIDTMRAGLEKAIPGAHVAIIPTTNRVN